jgi:ribulose-5-phosphate 4-epimerase/fuculose-1-phosphate aldolase
MNDGAGAKRDAKPARDDAAWQARVDLAASHRMAVMHGLNEGICNHFTMNVPGRPGCFFAIPYGLHWAEVKASDFLVVDYAGKVVEGEGEIELTAWCIHAPIHRLKPEANVLLHTHMPFATSLTMLQDQRLEPLGQPGGIIGPMICYDEEYTGLAHDPAEGERLAAKMEDGKPILFMAGHGVMVSGRTLADAYDRLYYLERACQVQVYAYMTGQPRRRVRQDVLATLRQQVKFGLEEGGVVSGGASPAQRHFDALKRVLIKRGEGDFAS